jgi:hypothetical protein
MLTLCDKKDSDMKPVHHNQIALKNGMGTIRNALIETARSRKNHSLRVLKGTKDWSQVQDI